MSRDTIDGGNYPIRKVMFPKWCVEQSPTSKPEQPPETLNEHAVFTHLLGWIGEIAFYLLYWSRRLSTGSRYGIKLFYVLASQR